MRRLLLLVPIALLSGCLSGNFQFAPGTVVGQRLVSEYHPNGQLKDQGYVGINDQGVEVKTGQWQWWFDNGQLQWQGSYLNGAINANAAWREWNRRGSLRDTWIDR